jgi:hypothetical protein
MHGVKWFAPRYLRPQAPSSRMLDFCSELDLVVADTMVRPRRRRREGTWYHIPSKTWFSIWLGF